MELIVQDHFGYFNNYKRIYNVVQQEIDKGAANGVIYFYKKKDRDSFYNGNHRKNSQLVDEQIRGKFEIYTQLKQLKRLPIYF